MPEHEDGEPLRPGWYPTGDGQHQRFYAGRGKGWTNRYTVEVTHRDPLSYDTAQPLVNQIGEILILLSIALVAVTLTISLVFTLITRSQSTNPKPPEAPVQVEEVLEISNDAD